MFKKKIQESCEVQPLIDFINANPHEFIVSHYTIKHKTTDLEIWIANAPDNYGFYGPNWLEDGKKNKFDNESQVVFHKFIQKFADDYREKERKEKVAAKIKMLVGS